ncbi:hypothetical protein RB195_014973 [Necator americanus]|uniref:Uncharacterized protein n=1 Tax=Necator americanus TaxID=51031 RepID=A0ABR1E2F3_NECAM
MKRCSPVLDTPMPVGEANLTTWRDHFNTLLNRQLSSAPEHEHIRRPSYVDNEEPLTESEFGSSLYSKHENGKSGGDESISAKMLKYLPPSGIREMTKIIRSVWIDERTLIRYHKVNERILFNRVKKTRMNDVQRASCLSSCPI